MAVTTGSEKKDFRIVTKERLAGNAQRWRRFGEPVPAGHSLKEDGTPDYGLFGPGSMVWQVLLHPATIVFQYAFQGCSSPRTSRSSPVFVIMTRCRGRR